MAGRTIKARALSCPNCGARLRWGASAEVIECRYCQTHVVVETGRVTQEATTVVSSPAFPMRGIVVGAAALVLVSGTIAAVQSARRGSRPAQSPAARQSTTAALLATPIAATAQDVARRHGVAVISTTVTLKLSDGPYASSSWSWHAEHPEHVSSITLWPREGTGLEPVAAKARAQLGGALRESSKSYQFGHRGSSISLSATTIQINTGSHADPKWKDRFAVLWRVIRGSAFGTGETIDVETRRAMFNLDYPVETLANIGHETVVDDAAREVQRVAPAAESDGPRHTIGLDHPWIESASLSWDNKPGGKWYSVTLYFPPEIELATAHETIERCLTPVLGKANRLVDDHLAGTFRLQYPATNGNPWVDVGARTLSIYPHYTFGTPSTEAGFDALIAAIAACR